MQEAITNTESVVLSTKTTPDVSIIDAMTASCAFFVSYQVNSDDLFDGFYFSNLPTRAVIRPNQPANILAHQTDPFIGNTWANWFLRKVFNETSIETLQSRFNEDEELASQHGVLIYHLGQRRPPLQGSEASKWGMNLPDYFRSQILK